MPKHRYQQPPYGDPRGLHGNDLVIGVHAAEGDEEAEKKGHGDGHDHHLREREVHQEHGVLERNPLHEDLLHELEGGSHEEDRRVGDEPHDRGSRSPHEQ